MFPTHPRTLAALLLLTASTAFAAQPAAFGPFLKAHCIDCHDADTKKGGLDLTALDFKDDITTHTQWVHVFDRISSGEMPPAKRTRPPALEQSAFLTVLGKDITQQHQAMKGTVLRRLNRIEYQNTLNDAFGVQLNLVRLLPDDSLLNGFDNQGEALSMSDVQLKRYLEAAEKTLDALSLHETKPELKKEKYSYNDPLFSRSLSEDLTSGGGKWLLRPDGAVVFFTGGYPNTALRQFSAWGDGRYKIRITGYAYQTPKPVVFALQVGNSSGLFLSTSGIATHGYYSLPPNTPTTVEVDHWFARGETLRITPEGLGPKPGTPGLHLLKGGVAAYQGSGLAILGVEIEGPFLDEWPTSGHELLYGNVPLKETAPSKKGAKRNTLAKTREAVSEKPADDSKRLLKTFATRLFRRPVSDEKLAPYLALFNAELKRGASFEDAMRTAASAVLCAPDFLYFHESAGKLDDYALASRLAYFLWRSLPDDELLKLAAAGKLKQPAVLKEQTERLLANPKTKRFAADFTDGWLDLRSIEFTTPDKQLYPEFDDQLQFSIVAETRAFFSELITHNLPVSNIIQSDFAMLDARLAKHYGIPGIDHLDIKKEPLPPGSKRGGFLTQASVLKVSANGTNTSPVIRGVWVMDRILGFKPPPPPPGVPGVEPDIRGATTVREMLVKHRTMESCNVCHRVIDPPGFALENYDVIGGWRDRFRSLGEGDNVNLEYDRKKVRYKLGKPVDASGDVAGEKFGGFAEFQKLLLKQQDPITASLASRLLAFATGRELGFSDRTEVAKIVQAVKTKNGGVRDLLHLVIQSEIFSTK
ncbi:MAG: DUF1592 domain-containing protein [Planctomycetota bacterium]